MNRFILFLLFGISGFSQKTDIAIVGSDHFSQVFKEGIEASDVLSEKAQKSLARFNNRAAKFKPDLIMVEELPENQPKIDSLYALFRNGKIALQDLGRSEVFQIAFVLGKRFNLDKIHCVNAPGGTSQSLLDNGDNIELYKNETVELRKVVSEKYAKIQSGELSFNDYLTFLNQPETYYRIYHLRYITPSRITNGTFKNPEKEIDTSKIDKRYIGAELTAIWKKRDYQMYSNIATLQLKFKPKRMLLVIGVAHIGSLKSILQDDVAFDFVEARRFLNEKRFF